jgi:hypothetical protein
MEDEHRWDGPLQGWKWKRREWISWASHNPNWAEEWVRPEDWLPGEKQWFEGEESWGKIQRAQKEEVRLRFEALSDEEKERKVGKWEAEKAAAKAKENAKLARKLKELVKENEGWQEYCAQKVKELTELNPEEKTLVIWKSRLKRITEELNQRRLELQGLSGGSEGHLLTHPDEVSVTVPGDNLAAQAITLSEGVCGDDPSTTEEEILEEDQPEDPISKEDGSEGHLPIHPDKVSVTVTGDHLAELAITLSKGVGEDDSSITVGEKEEDLVKPTPPTLTAREKAFQDEREGVIRSLRLNPRWRSVKQGVEKRHVKRHQAFRNRRRRINRGEYEESLRTSPLAEQADWESVEKGSKLWLERQALFWKIEAERMFEFFGTKGDLSLEIEDQKWEWKLRHLEIPFIRYPRRDEVCQCKLRLADNQETIQAMIERNPLFKEQVWMDK